MADRKGRTIGGLELCVHLIWSNKVNLMVVATARIIRGGEQNELAIDLTDRRFTQSPSELFLKSPSTHHPFHPSPNPNSVCLSVGSFPDGQLRDIPPICKKKNPLFLGYVSLCGHCDSDNIFWGGKCQIKDTFFLNLHFKGKTFFFLLEFCIFLFLMPFFALVQLALAFFSTFCCSTLTTSSTC